MTTDIKISMSWRVPTSYYYIDASVFYATV